MHVDRCADGLRMLCVRDGPERRRALDPMQQLLPPGPGIFVQHHDVYVRHLQRRRVGEEEQLDDGRSDQDGATPRVAQEGQKLLDDQGFDAHPPHLSQSFCGCCARPSRKGRRP